MTTNETPVKLLCIYHGNCADGFGAAWVVRKAFNSMKLDELYCKIPEEDLELKFHAGVYQQPPPDVTDTHVLLVDFSYKRHVIEEMLKVAKSVRIIDHHKTAIEDLASIEAPNFFKVFDIERSGAMLTWLTLMENMVPPQLLRHIEDRDLWKFELEDTRQIQAALFSYPYDFNIWDNLMRKPVTDLAKEGFSIERKHFKDIDELIKVGMTRQQIAGYNVPVLNVPYTLSSDAGNQMAIGEPFAACYMDTQAGRVFSLRSITDHTNPEGIDVSEIAKLFGGGGHKNAAGFTLPRADLDTFDTTWLDISQPRTSIKQEPLPFK